MARSSVFLLRAFFHHSWLLRRFPSCLLECLARQLTPQLSFLSSSPPILLCVVSLDTGGENEDCLIIISASSWIPSKVEVAQSDQTQAGGSCHLCNCIWFPPLPSSPSLIFLSVKFMSYLLSENFFIQQVN